MSYLRRFALFVLVCGVLLGGLGSTMLLAENSPTLANVKKVYVEKMKNNLDQYITAEISRQFHGSLTVVLAREEADAIMKGINIDVRTSEATVQLVDPAGKLVLWSGTGNDRNKLIMTHEGEQGVASHLVKDLRKSMQR